MTSRGQRLLGLLRRLRLLAVVVLCCLCVSDTGAQRRWRRRVEPMERSIFPSNSFTFCRVQYSSDGGRRRGGWATDYPASDENFSLRLSQLTTLNVARTDDGRFRHVVVRLDEPDLFKYPFIYALEIGSMALTPPEQDGLRAYLLRGGFLLVDDFWGDDAWDNLEFELAQVLPREDYPFIDLPLDHELFHIVFDLAEVPQVPSVHHYREWVVTGQSFEGGSFRYERYGHAARCRVIFDKKGRLMVVAMHNSDLGDGWEREGENYGYFRDFSAKKAYPMGINIVVYAMTH
jgi:hypothetical protein